MPSSSDRPPAPTEAAALRVDAARNRTALVEAARAVFAERGLDVPLGETAQRAGVGIGTLYRRFPTREDLIAASFAPLMAAYAQAVEEALQAPDAWTGFARFLERVCAMQAADCGGRDVLTLTFPMAPAFEEQRQRAYDGFTELVRRAQAEGALRSDFVAEDLVLLLMANAGVVQGTQEAAPAAWQRFVALVLEALCAEQAHPLPPPPTPAQMYRALLRLGRGRGRGDDRRRDTEAQEDQLIETPPAGHPDTRTPCRGGEDA
jgi:AcrR family transcriptional regulator